MRILGVDPGSIITGYGVIDHVGSSLTYINSGTIAMKASQPLSLRLNTIYRDLSTVIDTYHPDEFCIETAFYGKNIQSTLKLGHVRGVAILAAVHKQLAISEYSPREVKRSVTGSGAASKQQIEYMVRTILHIDKPMKHFDETDGIALAVTHASHITAPRMQFANWSEFVARYPEKLKL